MTKTMNKENFAKLFTTSLERYNFKHYGSKLFYLDLSDVIIILKHLIWNGGGEVYLELIIKECHFLFCKFIYSNRFTFYSYLR